MKDSKLREIFRAYDVRGEYPEVLNESVMEKIGRAYATNLIEGDILGEEETIILGRDARKSSPNLTEAFVKGVTEMGINVEDLGRVSFGLVLLKSFKEEKETTYITASHLPKGWNGIKFYHSNGIGWTEEENYGIRDTFLSEEFKPRDSSGKRIEINYSEEYKGELLSKIKLEKPIDIILDCGNGTSGIIAPELFREAGFEVTTIFEEPDGDFPNRDPGVKAENLSKIRKRAKYFDMGIAYDGDSDRMVLIDDQGRVLSAGETSYMLLKWILENEKGPVIANVEVSKLVEDIAHRYDREVRRIKVGHTFLFKETIELGGCFGAESSGHYCIPFFLPLDDGISCSLFAAWVVSNLDKKLSEIVDEMPSYEREREAYKCPDSDKFEVVERLKKMYSSEFDRLDKKDGLRVVIEEGWALIRASNTSPKIRVTVESDSRDKAEKIRKKFSADLKEEIQKVAGVSQTKD